MTKIYLTALLFLFISSCSVLKKQVEVPNDANVYDPEAECLEHILKAKTKDHRGPVKLTFRIDTVEVGSKITPVNKVYTEIVNKESELIKVTDSIAIKLFHTEVMEYGSLRHLVKFDFFIKDDNCWKRKVNMGYSYASFSDSSQGMGSFTEGYRGDYFYFRAVYLLSRVK